MPTHKFSFEVGNTMNQSENTLIRDLKQGSKKAFDLIYQMYAKRLYAYSLQFTKSSEDAEEIVQDVFVKLWINRENIRQEETLRSLLFIMTKHYLINAFRAKLNSPTYEEYVVWMEELSSEETHYDVEYKDFLRQLDQALIKLHPTQKKIIELSRFQQLSNKEIAEQLSLSEQTVKNQLSLGLKNLREELSKLLVALWLLMFVN